MPADGDLTAALGALIEERRSLSDAEASAAMDALMSGDADPHQASALLAALRLKGETVDGGSGAGADDARVRAGR